MTEERSSVQPVESKVIPTSPNKHPRRSMSPSRRIERSVEVCKTIERESKDVREEPSRNEKPPDITKDYYYGVLNSGLVKLYRQYDAVLGLDQMFIKRYKKAKYDGKYAAGLVELVVNEFQSDIKQSINSYATQYKRKFSAKKVVVPPPMGRRNANSMHSNFKSALKDVRRPMVKNRYEIER